MRDSSSSASGCQLLQEGRGRKAVVGTWLPMLAKHRERSRMLPLCSRQTLLAGLPSDSSRTRTPPGPKSFLVWFYLFFFLSHTGGCNVKAIPRPQSAYSKHPISSLLCQGGLYIFHKVSKYAFRENIFPWLQILLMPSNCLCNSASTELMK